MLAYCFVFIDVVQECVCLLVCCGRLPRVVDVVVDSQLFDVQPCV